MTVYISNAVDIPAVMSSSNGDYVRTGGPQALYVAGDGNLVTYTYANSSNNLPAISGGFQPMPTLPSDAIPQQMLFSFTLNFVNPTAAIGFLSFTIIQPTVPETLAFSLAELYSIFSPGFVTLTPGLNLPITTDTLNALRSGTLRWTIGWSTGSDLTHAVALPGQSLVLDRVWLTVFTVAGIGGQASTLTAPAFSTGQSRFDTRKDWTVTG